MATAMYDVMIRYAEVRETQALLRAHNLSEIGDNRRP